MSPGSITLPEAPPVRAEPYVSRLRPPLALSALWQELQRARKIGPTWSAKLTFGFSSAPMARPKGTIAAARQVSTVLSGISTGLSSGFAIGRVRVDVMGEGRPRGQDIHRGSRRSVVEQEFAAIEQGPEQVFDPLRLRRPFG